MPLIPWDPASPNSSLETISGCWATVLPCTLQETLSVAINLQWHVWLSEAFSVAGNQPQLLLQISETILGNLQAQGEQQLALVSSGLFAEWPHAWHSHNK